MNIKKEKIINGYIALISVLIVSALLVLIVASFNFISIGETDISLREKQSWESFYLATACAEEALLRLREDINYGGNEVLTLENGSCTILLVEGAGNTDRVVKVYSSAYNTTRRIKVEISLVNPEMVISSWQEVDGF